LKVFVCFCIVGCQKGFKVLFQHIFVKMKQKKLLSLVYCCLLRFHACCGEAPMTGRVQALRLGCANFGAGWCLGELGALGTEQVVALAVAADVVQHDVAASLPRDVLIRRGWEGLKPQDGVLK
jgi:hypothetical protein